MANEEQNKKTYIDYYRTKRSLEFMNRYDKDRAWEKLNVCLRRKRLYRRLISVSSVAAVFVAVLTCFYLWVDKNEMSPEVGLADLQETTEKHKSPGVILFLADGQQVDLSGQEKEIPGGNIKNDSENKQLLYSAEQNPEQLIQFNRIEVPRGTDYQLVLSDGSKVWVNARSCLTYPVSFGDVREVTLEGEAYFEVARDEDRPFVVRTENLTVKVLGTEFNINAHSSEKVQTVLVKGGVEAETAGRQKVVLQPGELAESGRSQIRVSKVNVRKYTAWREGMFYFEEATLEEILQELCDWYYVQVVFTNPSARMRKFSGILERNDDLEKVLKKIELTTSVRFTVQKGMIKVE